MTIEALTLDVIRTDGGTQARGALDAAWVDELAAIVGGTDGALDAIVVFYDGADYWLADGFHRVAAYARAGRGIIRAEVHQGTRRDAVLHACGANATHGLKRTNADKRRAVETLLRDAEWSRWPDREIARRCGVGNALASEVRRAICLIQTDAPTTRTVERNGVTYEQNTANIGRKPADAPAPQPQAPAPRVETAAEPDDDYDYEAAGREDVELDVVEVEPEPFVTPVAIERSIGPLSIERHAADLATAIRSAHALIVAVLNDVPAIERAAVVERVERPIHLLLDVVEQLAPTSAPKGWRPTVIAGGRS